MQRLLLAFLLLVSFTPARAELPKLISKSVVCPTAFTDHASFAFRDRYEDIVDRASIQLGAKFPGARFNLSYDESEIQITATGIENAVILILGHFTPKEVPGSDFVIDVIRVQDYEASDNKIDRFRRQGIGTLLTKMIVEMVEMKGVRSVSARLEQTNKEMFLKSFRADHDVTRAVESSFLGAVFKSLGFEVDLAHSLIGHVVDENGEPLSYLVTWRRDSKRDFPAGGKFSPRASVPSS